MRRAMPHPCSGPMEARDWRIMRSSVPCKTSDLLSATKRLLLISNSTVLILPVDRQQEIRHTVSESRRPVEFVAEIEKDSFSEPGGYLSSRTLGALVGTVETGSRSPNDHRSAVAHRTRRVEGRRDGRSARRLTASGSFEIKGTRC